MPLNILLAFALVGPFELRGLAAAASITAILEFLVLTSLLRGRIGGFDRQGLGSFAARLALATVVMVQVMLLMRLLLGAADVDTDGTGGAILIVVASGAAGLATFIAAALLLLGEEYRQARAALRR